MQRAASPRDNTGMAPTVLTAAKRCAMKARALLIVPLVCLSAFSLTSCQSNSATPAPASVTEMEEPIQNGETTADYATILNTAPDWLSLPADDPGLQVVLDHLRPLMGGTEEEVRSACSKFLATYKDDPDNYTQRASVVLLVNRMYFAAPAEKLWPLQEVDGKLKLVGTWVAVAEYYQWEVEFLHFSDTYGRRSWN